LKKLLLLCDFSDRLVCFLKYLISKKGSKVFPCKEIISLVYLFGTFYSLQVSGAYDRYSAYNYAYKYYDKVVSDGYFWENTSFPSYLGAGTAVPLGGYDCAHFVSCVIGSEPHENGGGSNIPSRTIAYGEPGANNLGNFLISSGQGIEVYSIDQLQIGDVILYDWDGDGWYNHSAVYLGNYKVAAHSNSVWNAFWTLGGAVMYRFIHVNSSAQTFSVTLYATPQSGAAPLSTILTATVSGTATGPIDYIFYADRSDSEIDITPDYIAKFNGITDNLKSISYTYSSPGTYIAKVIVKRSSCQAEARIPITVSAIPSDAIPPTPPTNLFAKAINSSRINLNWVGSTDSGGSGLAGYIIERSTDGMQFERKYITTSTYYEDVYCYPGTTYYYRVCAYDYGENYSSYSNIAFDTTPEGTAFEVNINPSTLDFNTSETQKSFDLIVTGTGNLIWNIGTPIYNEGNGWIASIAPGGGNITVNNSISVTSVTITINKINLDSGTYTATIPVITSIGNKYIFVSMAVLNMPLPLFQNIRFYDSNGNQITGGIPVDNVVRIKGDYTAGSDGTQVGTSLWIIKDHSTEQTIYVSTVTTGDLTSLWLERNILLPGTSYILMSQAANTNNIWSVPTVICFTTLPLSQCSDTNGDGVPDNQNPRGGQTGENSRKTVLFNGNTVTVESITGDRIAYFAGISPLETPPYGDAAYGVFISRIELTNGPISKLKFTFPTNLPAETKWYKYIECASSGQRWIEYSDVTIVGNTVTILLRDGEKGDADGAANGVIVNQSGPVLSLITSSGDGRGNGECFIATAAFGSPLVKQVKILRIFRDQYLLTNYLGRKFVSFYYRNSRKLADFISVHSLAKYFTRVFLYPLIFLAFLINKGVFFYLALFCAGGMLIMLISKTNKNKDSPSNRL